LLLGGSETIGLFADLFALVDKKHKIYTKVEINPRHEVGFLPKPFLPDAIEPAGPLVSPYDSKAGAGDLNRSVDRLLLAQFSPSGVVINARMEIVQFRGQTAAFLEHSPGDASLNLLRLLRQDLLVDVRTAISRAAKTDTRIRKQGIEFTHDGKKRLLNLEVIPFKMTPSVERFYLVVFNEHPAESGAEKPGKAQSGPPEVRRELTRLREELGSTKESLQAIIEDHEATNEELKSANEEIQSSNEELQSTNEELETAKEELQSTNEELMTLNEELQTRNTELSQLNNDLGNLLSSVSMPILMLGSDLTIRRFTPVAERFFNLIPSDVGRRITDINPNIQISHLDKLVTEVIDSLKTQEHEVQDREGRWYSLRIRPYRTTENKIDGAVVMMVDVDEIKRGLTEFMSLINQPLLTLRGDLRVQQANEVFHEVFKTTPKEVENKLIYDLQDGVWNIAGIKNMLEAALSEKNRVDNVQVQLDLPLAGRKLLRVNARRLYQRSKGTQLTLLAFTELDNGVDANYIKIN
jgi:two-component system CheB/CheR fusion protein